MVPKRILKVEITDNLMSNKHLKIATQIRSKNQMKDDAKFEMKSNKNPPSKCLTTTKQTVFQETGQCIFTVSPKTP